MMRTRGHTNCDYCLVQAAEQSLAQRLSFSSGSCTPDIGVCVQREATRKQCEEGESYPSEFSERIPLFDHHTKWRSSNRAANDFRTDLSNVHQATAVLNTSWPADLSSSSHKLQVGDDLSERVQSTCILATLRKCSRSRRTCSPLGPLGLTVALLPLMSDVFLWSPRRRRCPCPPPAGTPLGPTDALCQRRSVRLQSVSGQGLNSTESTKSCRPTIV